MQTPNVPVNHVPAKTGEIFSLGTVKIRIMEDGSRTGPWRLNPGSTPLADDEQRVSLLDARSFHEVVGFRSDETTVLASTKSRMWAL